MAVTFLKKGKEAHKALKKAQKEAEARAAARGAFRFWVPIDEEKMVTFLDGDLTEDGLLDTTSYNQHNIKINGKFRNYFVCIADNEPCPLCEMGNYATLVSLFTVIDHSRYVDRNGKMHTNERKLFVAKGDTMKRLQKFASKRGGLRGWSVTIGRTGERSAEVGTDFDFIEEQDLDDLAASLKMKREDLEPLDYDKEIKYLTASELRELGFGSEGIGAQEVKEALGKKAKKKVVEDDADEDEDDDDDSPPFAKAKSKVSIVKKKAKVVEDDDDDDDAEDDDDDVPAPKVKAKAKTKKVVKKPVKVTDDDDDDDEDEDDEDDL